MWGIQTLMYRHATSVWQSNWCWVAIAPRIKAHSVIPAPPPELSRNVLRPACGSVGPCSIRSCLSRQTPAATLFMHQPSTKRRVGPQNSFLFASSQTQHSSPPPPPSPPPAFAVTPLPPSGRRPVHARCTCGGLPVGPAHASHGTPTAHTHGGAGLGGAVAGESASETATKSGSQHQKARRAAPVGSDSALSLVPLVACRRRSPVSPSARQPPPAAWTRITHSGVGGLSTSGGGGVRYSPLASPPPTKKKAPQNPTETDPRAPQETPTKKINWQKMKMGFLESARREDSQKSSFVMYSVRKNLPL